jgi:hypothetical protein
VRQRDFLLHHNQKNLVIECVGVYKSHCKKFPVHRSVMHYNLSIEMAMKINNRVALKNKKYLYSSQGEFFAIFNSCDLGQTQKVNKVAVEVVK